MMYNAYVYIIDIYYIYIYFIYTNIYTSTSVYTSYNIYICILTVLYTYFQFHELHHPGISAEGETRKKPLFCSLAPSRKGAKTRRASVTRSKATGLLMRSKKRRCQRKFKRPAACIFARIYIIFIYIIPIYQIDLYIYNVDVVCV